MSLVIIIVFYKWMVLFRISVGKNPPANSGDEGSTFGQEDPLYEEMATKISIFACEITQTRKLMATLHGVAKSWTRLTAKTTQAIKNI